MRQNPETDELAPVLDALARRGHAVAAVTAMPGDVSRRRYFRVRLAEGSSGGPDGRQAILSVYPQDTLDACRRYLEAARLLAGQRVRVAEVIDGDCTAGWVLLEDLGERTLYEHEDRPWDELFPYFEDALDAIARISALPIAAVARLNPPLDRDLLCRELAQTRELFLEPLGLDGGDRLGGELRAALDAICARLASQSPVPCHRDFGARNLMPLEVVAIEATEEGGARPCRVGVLDHQDLRLGPPAYDLASLLNDSLFPPPEIEERLLARAGLPVSGSGREPYHRAAAQRTLKAIGSYAAFAHRGSGRHLRLIPPTLARSLHHLGRLSETEHLVPRLSELWRPALEGSGLERLVVTPEPVERD